MDANKKSLVKTVLVTATAFALGMAMFTVIDTHVLKKYNLA